MSMRKPLLFTAVSILYFSFGFRIVRLNALARIPNFNGRPSEQEIHAEGQSSSREDPVR